MAKRALLTGASGYIGGRLAGALLDGGWELTLLTRENSGLPEALTARSEVAIHDGTTEQLALLVQDARPDVVLHLASLYLAAHTPADIEPLIRSNVLFGTQLLEACVAEGVTRFLDAGTAWEYFEGRPEGVNLYAATKRAFHEILTTYASMYELSAITVEVCDTYGPDDPRPKIMALLDRIAASGETLAMSPGEQLIDLVHVDDAVAAFVRATELLIDAPAGHQRYAITSGELITLRELVARYEASTGKAVSIEWGGRPYRPREVMVPWTGTPIVPG